MKKERAEQLEICNCFPVIDICNHWKDGEETRQYRDTDLVYDYKGSVWYVDEKGKRKKMSYKGYDKSTDSLRYGFPPRIKDHRISRIKCEEDHRIFTPVARDRKNGRDCIKSGVG